MVVTPKGLGGLAGPSLAAAASPLAGRSPPPAAPAKAALVSTPKVNAADPHLTDASRDGLAKQNAARENVQQSVKEAAPPTQKVSPSSSSTSGAKCPISSPSTAKDAAPPSLPANATSSPAVGSTHEPASVSADQAQSSVGDKAQQSADVVKTKSNQGRSDTDAARGARASRGDCRRMLVRVPEIFGMTRSSLTVIPVPFPRSSPIGYLSSAP